MILVMAAIRIWAPARKKKVIGNSITPAMGMLAASEVLGSAVRSVLDLLSIRPGRGNMRRTEKL